MEPTEDSRETTKILKWLWGISLGLFVFTAFVCLMWGIYNQNAREAIQHQEDIRVVPASATEPR